MVKIVTLMALCFGKFEEEFEYHLLFATFCLIQFSKGGLLVMSFKTNLGQTTSDPCLNLYMW
jgi:hypothetical protein